ncbi:MAG: hypothetical protein MZV64_36330 [Ignavibacteriales bacterium]|nr:hypothetical protein [Ignavibacteriales bacterium]
MLVGDPERHDRLEVEERAGGLAVADAHVPVCLEWHADEARHRVLRLLRQLSGLGTGRGPSVCVGLRPDRGGLASSASKRAVTAPARMVHNVRMMLFPSAAFCEAHHLVEAG